MNYQCNLCNKDITLETGSYSFVRSEILLHLDRCDVSGRMSTEQRSAEASKAADIRFFVNRPAPRNGGDSRPPNQR